MSTQNEYNYNVDNQVTSWYSNNRNTIKTGTYTYDRFGNCSQAELMGNDNGKHIEQTIQYAYDGFQQLVDATDITDTSNHKNLFHYVYDMDGRRISKSWRDQEGSTLKRYQFYNGDTVVADTSGPWHMQFYIMGNGLLGLCNSTAARMYLYDCDARGDVRRTTCLDTPPHAPSIVTECIYKYNAYGQATDTVSSGDSNPYRFAGAYYDEESGFYRMGARYYDTVTGRFTQRDTYLGDISQPGTLNLYNYCGGNPVKYVDPTGHFWETVFDIGSLALSIYDFVKKPSLGNAL